MTNIKVRTGNTGSHASQPAVLDRPAVAKVPSAPVNTAPTAFGATALQPISLVEASGSVGSPAENVSGLPDAVGNLTNGLQVKHGGERAGGGFYCAHTNWILNQLGMRPDTSILRNAQGESLAGFLHIPVDKWTEKQANPKDYTQAERHQGTREVVGLALAGYAQEAAAKVPANEPIRMMVSGFGAFDSLVNNPTGDFIAHPENLDASMKLAFGKDLLTAQGTKVSDGPEGTVYKYQVRDPKTGQPRDVLIDAKALPVSDDAMSARSPGSLQGAIGKFKPHAVISLGVNPRLQAGDGVIAESRAHDRRMRTDANGGIVHDDNAPGTAKLVNYSLSRAIYTGTQGQTGELLASARQAQQAAGRRV